MLMLMVTSRTDAREVAGVALESSIELPLSALPLQLHGAGVREKFFLDIYVAALYAPRLGMSAAALLEADVPKRMLMHFTYSEVDKDKMDAAWEDGFAANLDAQQLSQLQESLDRFKSLFGNMQRGDEVWLDYIPGTGTLVQLNGQRMDMIAGAGFGQALFSVWLGRVPVTSDLRRGLLGQ
jgi:hypothetical protein